MNNPSIYIILDTNIWIDIFIFKDPRTQIIEKNWLNQTLHVAINQACFDELKQVLDYPQFTNKNFDKSAILQSIADRSTFITETFDQTVSLPQCQDTDDQKFLELAYLAKSQWLITKDKALLKLAKRALQTYSLNICLPEIFTAKAL